MRVLVTGGAGFIGAQVVVQMCAASHEVVALDCLHPAAHANPADGANASVRGLTEAGATMIVGDVRDPDVMAEALRGIDAVAHQAAMVGMGVDLNDMPEYVGCNDLGTAVLLAAMARSGVRRLVLASSMVVYGEGAYSCPRHGGVHPAPRAEADLAAGRFDPRCPDCAQPLTPALVGEDAPLAPRSVYAATKLAQEHLAGAWARETGSEAVALRYHNVYGPGMPRDTPYAGVAAIFRSSLERGQAPRVFEDGAQRRDFVHVSDVARANVAALALLGDASGPTTRSTGGEGGRLRPYNIASGTPHTVSDMATALTRALAGPEPIITGEYRRNDVRHVVASPERARRELGFTATVAFYTGMTEFASAPLRGYAAGPAEAAV